jgi:hypothetical protein
MMRIGVSLVRRHARKNGLPIIYRCRSS